MLIGSIKPLQAPYLKSFLFARRSEKSFSRTEIPFQSTHESRKSQSAARAHLSQSPYPMFFIGTLSQTLTLRAAFASSTYLLSQIPGPGRSSDDDLLIPLISFSRGHIRACGLSIAARLSLPANSGPASDDAFSALEGGACEAGGPGPHGGFLLLGMTTSVSWKFITTSLTTH